MGGLDPCFPAPDLDAAGGFPWRRRLALRSDFADAPTMKTASEGGSASPLPSLRLAAGGREERRRRRLVRRAAPGQATERCGG